MNLSSINLRFFANIAPLVSGLNKAERAMDRAGKKMQAVGKNLTMKVTAPIVGLGAVAVNTFQGFELQMAKVKAVSGATGAEFEALSKNAKDLGASTIFSAKQVAELQTEFAKLGFTAAEITQVTEATLALAQATDSDLARAAEVAGSTLRAFQLDASETERVTDVMAKSFSTSALDMETFAESMKYVAPVAKSAGMSIEETTAMLSVMANAGIKGSQAGTSLRRIISELGTGSEPVAEKIKQLANAGIGLADAKDEVGRSAQSALLVLAGGVDQIDPTTKSLEGAAGAAKEMASIMDNTGSGSMKALQSAFEGLMISIGEIIATGFTPFIKVLTSVVQGINAMPGPLKAVIVGDCGVGRRGRSVDFHRRWIVSQFRCVGTGVDEGWRGNAFHRNTGFARDDFTNWCRRRWYCRTIRRRHICRLQFQGVQGYGVECVEGVGECRHRHFEFVD
jgi:phage-related minor tail protein